LEAVKSYIELIRIEIAQLNKHRRPQPGGQYNAWKRGKAVVDARVDEKRMLPEAASVGYQRADRTRCYLGLRSCKEATEQGVPDTPGFAGRRDQKQVGCGMNGIVAGGRLLSCEI